MELDVLNLNGEKVSTVELPSAIFEAPVSVDLMHQAYVRQMANARLGTHDTKVRGEVAGGGRKPWRQKGTGRARQGSIRSAHWKGGGRIHTPHPRDYVKSMPKKMRRAALRSALSVKAAEMELVIVNDLNLEEAKTSYMVKVLDKLVGDASALILVPSKSEEYGPVMRSTRNITDAKIILAGYLNIRDLLQFEKLIIPMEALEVIKGYLG